MVKTALSHSCKLTGWKKDYPWLEMDDTEGKCKIRCSACNMAKTGTVWESFLRFCRALAAPVTFLPVLASDFGSACLAGGVSGLLIACPIENIITKSNISHIGIGAVIRKIAKTRAIMFFCGGPMFVCREVPFAASMFFLSGNLSHFFQSKFPLNFTKNISTSCQTSHANLKCYFIVGCSCALMVGPLTHVPSVIGTRQQALDCNASAAVQSLLQESGGKYLKAFSKGFVFRTSALAGTFTVVPLTFEFLRYVEG